jgi:disulfide bond formation protein DsbB
VAIFCLIGAFLKPLGARVAGALGLLAALAGAGVAIRHLWVQAHPNISCGIDPLETSLNTIFPAKLLPQLFQADGLCSAPYEPILSLSIPQWSLLWFVLIIVVLARLLLKKARA